DLLGGAWVPEIRGADLRWLYDEKDDCCPDGGLFSKRSHGVESPHNCPGSEPQMGTWCGSRANHAAGTSCGSLIFRGKCTTQPGVTESYFLAQPFTTDPLDHAL